MQRKVVEIIYAKGHENILSKNAATLEITRDTHLTRRGDCIIAVAADKAAADLSPRFKDTLRNDATKLVILIEADKEKETITAKGSKHLSLSHPHDMVVRKSSFICNRTLAIGADKAAADLTRTLIKKLQNSRQKVKITLIAEKAITPTR